MALFERYGPTPLNDVAVPPFPALEADAEEDSDAPGRDFDLEVPQHLWRPIAPGPPTEDVPERFVDGSIQSRTVASITVGFRRRPLIAATISAACLERDGRSLRRGSGTQTLKVLCLNSNGLEEADLVAARETLASLDVALQTGETEAAGDFDAMRRATRALAMTALEAAERDVMLTEAERPTLVDGLLERRLAGQRHDLPVTGLVKRQIATYLPPGLQELAYGLQPGERTPAFVLETVQHVPIINTYLRLSSPPGASPSYGLVRLTAPLEYVEKHHPGAGLGRYLSGLASFLFSLRQRDYAYARAGISIEPIVRVEEHLHAILPDIDVLVQRLHRLLAPAVRKSA